MKTANRSHKKVGLQNNRHNLNNQSEKAGSLLPLKAKLNRSHSL